MTARERLIAAARGGETDQRAEIVWPGPGGDATILPASEAQPVEARVMLAAVLNPLGRALAQGLDLNEALREDPEAGNSTLDRLVKETQDEIAEALERGADGIFYRLQGAHPNSCSPMQYGGYYLERDREILEGAHEAVLNVLFVEGGPETYLDFVSDLPAHVFAWDSASTGVDSAAIRAIRTGAQASMDPASEIVLGLRS